jgi:uncharacterized OB-fold protein
MVGFAAASMAGSGRLRYAFDEDDVTLLWDAAAVAALAPGTRIACDSPLPPWWWTGTGLLLDPSAPRALRLAATSAGPVAWVDDGAPRDPEALARAALTLAPPPQGDLARAQEARDRPDGEADYPLGAFVTSARHEELLAERMRLGPGKVATWTRIGAGAAPSEFLRLQDAVGDYHVAMVELDAGGRTVGLWSGAPPTVGQRTKPLLRRLYRQQGAWRHGVKYGPDG